MDTTDYSQFKELREKLLSYGIAQDEVNEVIDDVNNIIVAKVLKEYFSTINDPVINQYAADQKGQEILDYIDKNKEKFPDITKEQTQKIAEKMWSDYFNYMESNV